MELPARCFGPGIRSTAAEMATATCAFGFVAGGRASGVGEGLGSGRRDLAMADLYFKPEECAALRSFYSKMETKDEEPAVLKVTSQGSAAGN